MTAAAPASPQRARERLLQAIDPQSNICNMVVVMEVISYLEKCPITKEALEETRLGKLINDIRKKTKNEDLAKRAKKLLRTWQKLIEPGKDEVLSKGHAAVSWSSGATPPSGKAGSELKNRNDFNNCTPRGEKPSRKRKGDHTDLQFLPAKISKTTLNDKTQNSLQLLSNGISGNAELFTDTRSDRDVSEPSDNERLNKIPVNAVKPHPSAPGYSKPPSTSSLLKASVLQQQARREQAASGGRSRPRSPRSSMHAPQTPKQDAVVKQSAAHPQGISSLSVRPGTADPSGLGPSPQTLAVSVQGFRADGGSWSADSESQDRLCNTSLHLSAASSCSGALGLEDEGSSRNTGKRKRQNYSPKDYVVSSEGQTLEDGTKPVRLKDRRLTFDPVTGQITTSFLKDSSEDVEGRAAHRPELQRPEPVKPSPPVVPASPFQQTDWKELSRSEIIQSYLSQQSNVLTSSGAHTPSAHFFMTEFLKKEEHQRTDVKKTHVLASESPSRELPGVSREVDGEDLSRLHTQRWAGVNGCYDSKGTWYDWTDCISLDAHGDDSRLNILPYVCLD